MIQNLMTALLVATCFSSIAGSEISVDSYPGKDPVVVTITQEMLDRSPVWKETEENPPISARKAIGLADKLRQRDFEHTKNWRLRSISLESTRKGKWYWLLSYEIPPPFAVTGRLPDLRLVVLMDGTVVQPVTENR